MKPLSTIQQIDFDELASEAIRVINRNPINPQIKLHLLNELDYIELKRVNSQKAEHKINWSYIIKEKQTLDGGFDFGICWENENGLLGAVISAYKLPEECLEIYAVEAFDTAIKGKMMISSLYASYILLLLVGGKGIKMIDIEKDNSKLRNFYHSFGFTPINDTDFYLDIKHLETLFITKQGE